MTYEDAINYLKRSYAMGGTDDERQHNEVLDLAIKALEQQPCEKCEVGNPCLYCEYDFTEKKTKEPSEDCISREAVFDLVADFDLDMNQVVKGIRALPSVTPKIEWIPVSERLPEEQIAIGEYIFSKDVLGTEGYTIRRAYYNYTTKEWFDGNEEMEWTEITHWMPLP